MTTGIFFIDLAVALTVGGLASSLVTFVFFKRQEQSLKAKQELFIEKLNASLAAYAHSYPRDEDDVETRRKVVTVQVRQLSREIFRKELPVFESFRLEESEYPEILCRWCHRHQRPKGGSRGGCQHCDLPLDFWIGNGRASGSSVEKGELEAPSLSEGGHAMPLFLVSEHEKKRGEILLVQEIVDIVQRHQALTKRERVAKIENLLDRLYFLAQATGRPEFDPEQTRRSLASPGLSGGTSTSPQNGDRTMKDRSPIWARLARSYIRRSANEDPRMIDKWVYAALAGVIALAYTQELGGFSAVEGFLLAFSFTFVIILLLEVSADRIEKRQIQKKWPE